MRRSLSIALLVASVAVGCRGTLDGHMGMAALTVTTDPAVVERECHDVPALGRMLGCAIPSGDVARSVRVVRWTDALPSQRAFDVELHELCHATAMVQRLADPCHAIGGIAVR